LTPLHDPMAEEPSSQPSGGRPPAGKPGPSFGDLFWIGTACAIAIVGGGGLGYVLDSKFATLPWFTVAGLAFGVMSAVLLAVNQLRKYM